MATAAVGANRVGTTVAPPGRSFNPSILAPGRAGADAQRAANPVNPIPPPAPAPGPPTAAPGLNRFYGDAPRLQRDIAWSRGLAPGAPGSEYLPMMAQYSAPGSFWLQGDTDTFLAGDASAYANHYAGAAPSDVGNYSDTQSIADLANAQSNYGAGMAETDASIGNLNVNFAEALKALGKAKGKSLGGLADSMADRGLSNSGIFLKGTDETNDRFNQEQEGQTRAKDQQLGQFERNRTNLSNVLAQATAKANTDAFTRALKVWQDKKDAGLAQAQASLQAAGLM